MSEEVMEPLNIRLRRACSMAEAGYGIDVYIVEEAYKKIEHLEAAIAGLHPIIKTDNTQVIINLQKRLAEVDALLADVGEYLHWRKVNPHIKGGENYLKRMAKTISPFTEKNGVK